MKLLYNPEHGEPQQFEIEPANLMAREAEAIENVGGDAWNSFGQWVDKFIDSNIRARRALLWMLLRRSDPTLLFDDVNFRLDEFQILDDDEEALEVPKDESPNSDLDIDSPSPQPV